MLDEVSLAYTFEGTTLEGEDALPFCGPVAESTPLCPNCQKPFLQMLRIGTADERWDLKEVQAPYLDLIYCWRCNVAQGSFYYAVHGDGRIELLQYKLGDQGPDFPYEDYPEEFPLGWVLPVPMDPGVQESLRHINELNRADLPTHDYVHSFDDWLQRFELRHQIGGEPYRYDPTWTLKCVRCNKEMVFLAAIADSNTDPRGFVEDCGVHVLFHVCRPCGVVAARHEVD